MSAIPVAPVNDPGELQARRIAEGTAEAPAGGAQAVRPGAPTGQPLDPASRRFFEAQFGTNLGGVRIHNGGAAAQSAQSLEANAFTVGSDIVFGAGKYAPQTPDGRRLLAHELAHVAQQSAAGSAVVQREGPAGKKAAAPKKEEEKVAPGEFGPKYKGVKSRTQLTYDQYKAAIGTKDFPSAKAASKYGGTPIDPAKMEISEKDLRDILNPEGKGHVAGLDATIESYRDSINEAFAMMELDTVEAQAVYLAHAVGETGGLAQLEEKYTVEKVGYKDKGFEGRGPVQVTEDYNYLQTLAYLETYRDQLAQSKDPQAQKRLPLVTEALNAIKADPKEAANPKYTFLFSATFMQMAGGVRLSAWLKIRQPNFPGDKEEDSWVNSKRNNKQERDDAEASLKALQAKKADPAATDKPTDKQLAHANARFSIAKTIIGRSEKKAAAYARAVAILGKKKLQTQPTGQQAKP